MKRLQQKTFKGQVAGMQTWDSYIVTAMNLKKAKPTLQELENGTRTGREIWKSRLSDLHWLLVAVRRIGEYWLPNLGERESDRAVLLGTINHLSRTSQRLLSNHSTSYRTMRGIAERASGYELRRRRIRPWDGIEIMLVKELTDADYYAYLEHQKSSRQTIAFPTLGSFSEPIAEVFKKLGLKLDIDENQFSFANLWTVQHEVSDRLHKVMKEQSSKDIDMLIRIGRRVHRLRLAVDRLVKRDKHGMLQTHLPRGKTGKKVGAFTRDLTAVQSMTMLLSETLDTAIGLLSNTRKWRLKAVKHFKLDILPDEIPSLDKGTKKKIRAWVYAEVPNPLKKKEFADSVTRSPTKVDRSLEAWRNPQKYLGRT